MAAFLAAISLGINPASGAKTIKPEAGDWQMLFMVVGDDRGAVHEVGFRVDRRRGKFYADDAVTQFVGRSDCTTFNPQTGETERVFGLWEFSRDEERILQGRRPFVGFIDVVTSATSRQEAVLFIQFTARDEAKGYFRYQEKGGCDTGKIRWRSRRNVINPPPGSPFPPSPIPE